MARPVKMFALTVQLENTLTRKVVLPAFHVLLEATRMQMEEANVHPVQLGPPKMQPPKHSVLLVCPDFLRPEKVQ
jgi:hypothetical protein